MSKRHIGRALVAASCAATVAAALAVAGPVAAQTSVAVRGQVPSQGFPPGGLIWVRQFDGHGGQDIARSVAVSPSGGMVFVTGVTDVSTSNDNYLTVAYQVSSGLRAWTAEYSGAGGINAASSVAVSPDGSTVFVTGASAGQGSGDDFATVAYHAKTGTQLWARRWAGRGSSTDVATAVSAAGQATVLVTGTSSGPRGSRAVTIAYDAATGATSWIRSLAASSGVALAVGPGGGVGYVTGSNGLDFSTIAYSVRDGATKWVARYQARILGATPDTADQSRSITVGPSGRTVYITGTAGTAHRGTAHDYATVAYRASTGAQLWAHRYTGPGTGDDSAHSIATSPRGRTVYVTGASVGANGHLDYATIAYDGATGARLWVARFAGANDSNASAWVVRAGPGGGIVEVTGTVATDRGPKSVTLGYHAATGTVAWTATWTGQFMDSSQAMALGPHGSTAYIVGSTGDPGDDLDNFITVADKI